MDWFFGIIMFLLGFLIGRLYKFIDKFKKFIETEAEKNK